MTRARRESGRARHHRFAKPRRRRIDQLRLRREVTRLRAEIDHLHRRHVAIGHHRPMTMARDFRRHIRRPAAVPMGEVRARQRTSFPRTISAAPAHPIFPHRHQFARRRAIFLRPGVLAPHPVARVPRRTQAP